MTTYEYTRFSQQKSRADEALRQQINAKITSMKLGHLSNEKVITNGTNVLRSAGIPAKDLVANPVVREIRVTQSVRIFFYVAKNKQGDDQLKLVCLGHMDGNNVDFEP